MVVQFISKKELRLRKLEQDVESYMKETLELKKEVEKLKNENIDLKNELQKSKSIEVDSKKQDETNKQVQNIISQYLFGATKDNGGEPVQ